MNYSFLMCVNQKQDYLAEAVASVLNQEDQDFYFYIVANNCSEDLWSFLSAIKDERVKLYRTSIGQLSFNLNYGLNLIGEGYALRMDADDVCLPNRLSLTKKHLQINGWPDVMGGQAVLIDDCGQEIGLSVPPVTNESIRAALWKKSPMIHPTCALRVESVLRLRGYLGGFMSEDYDLWLRAARDPNFTFANISEPLIKYRISDGQSRKNALGYSEVAGFMLREGLLGSGLKYYAGAVLGVLKRYLRAKN